MVLRTAVFGASGYAGGELVRILDEHPGFEIVHLGAHRHEGGVLADVHPQLRNGERPLGAVGLEIGPIDIAFLALPHGASAALGYGLRQQGVKVVDLGSDYRFDTEERYAEAYGGNHPFPAELGQWRYGLPELFDVKDASAVASPGCYPTAVLLAIAPLIQAGAIANTGIVADCLSGVTGAGRSVAEEFLFGGVAEGVRAYAVFRHRHRPEIEMALDQLGGEGARVTFTPHLIPMQRGLLATVTAPALGSDDPRQILREAFADSPFVDVIDHPPQTRWTVGSNRAIVAAFVDERQGVVIAQCAIDNLGKGAAGQAVQAANLMVGYDETEGLALSGWLP
ncbi:N-acetyl-gamma-glutamyl-phosphate reductase [soil metagenome]